MALVSVVIVATLGTQSTVSYWHLRTGLIRALRRGEVADFARIFERRQGRALSSVRLENRPRVLTENGFVSARRWRCSAA